MLPFPFIYPESIGFFMNGKVQRPMKLLFFANGTRRTGMLANLVTNKETENDYSERIHLLRPEATALGRYQSAKFFSARGSIFLN